MALLLFASGRFVCRQKHLPLAEAAPLVMEDVQRLRRSPPPRLFKASSEAWGVFVGLTSPSPERRWSLDEVMEHPWVARRLLKLQPASFSLIWHPKIKGLLADLYAAKRIVSTCSPLQMLDANAVMYARHQRKLRRKQHQIQRHQHIQMQQHQKVMQQYTNKQRPNPQPNGAMVKPATRIPLVIEPQSAAATAAKVAATTAIGATATQQVPPAAVVPQVSSSTTVSVTPSPQVLPATTTAVAAPAQIATVAPIKSAAAALVPAKSDAAKSSFCAVAETAKGMFKASRDGAHHTAMNRGFSDVSACSTAESVAFNALVILGQQQAVLQQQQQQLSSSRAQALQGVSLQLSGDTAGGQVPTAQRPFQTVQLQTAGVLGLSLQDVHNQTARQQHGHQRPQQQLRFREQQQQQAAALLMRQQLAYARHSPARYEPPQGFMPTAQEPGALQVVKEAALEELKKLQQQQQHQMEGAATTTTFPHAPRGSMRSHDVPQEDWKHQQLDTNQQRQRQQEPAATMPSSAALGLHSQGVPGALQQFEAHQVTPRPVGADLKGALQRPESRSTASVQQQCEEAVGTPENGALSGKIEKSKTYDSKQDGQASPATVCSRWIRSGLGAVAALATPRLVQRLPDQQQQQQRPQQQRMVEARGYWRDGEVAQAGEATWKGAVEAACALLASAKLHKGGTAPPHSSAFGIVADSSTTSTAAPMPSLARRWGRRCVHVGLWGSAALSRAPTTAGDATKEDRGPPLTARAPVTRSVSAAGDRGEFLALQRFAPTSKCEAMFTTDAFGNTANPHCTSEKGNSSSDTGSPVASQSGPAPTEQVFTPSPVAAGTQQQQRLKRPQMPPMPAICLQGLQIGSPRKVEKGLSLVQCSKEREEETADALLPSSPKDVPPWTMFPETARGSSTSRTAPVAAAKDRSSSTIMRLIPNHILPRVDPRVIPDITMPLCSLFPSATAPEAMRGPTAGEPSDDATQFACQFGQRSISEGVLLAQQQELERQQRELEEQQRELQMQQREIERKRREREKQQKELQMLQAQLHRKRTMCLLQQRYQQQTEVRRQQQKQPYGAAGKDQEASEPILQIVRLQRDDELGETGEYVLASSRSLPVGGTDTSKKRQHSKGGEVPGRAAAPNAESISCYSPCSEKESCRPLHRPGISIPRLRLTHVVAPNLFAVGNSSNAVQGYKITSHNSGSARGPTDAATANSSVSPGCVGAFSEAVVTTLTSPDVSPRETAPMASYRGDKCIPLEDLLAQQPQQQPQASPAATAVSFLHKLVTSPIQKLQQLQHHPDRPQNPSTTKAAAKIANCFSADVPGMEALKQRAYVLHPQKLQQQQKSIHEGCPLMSSPETDT